jgi:hypothetical protein
MKYVSVRKDFSSLASVPALLLRIDGETALVRFAAGNLRQVPVDLVEPATPAEIREYLEYKVLRALQGAA